MHISDAVKRIDEYLKSGLNLPFFVSVECGSSHSELCGNLSGLNTIKVSDFCADDSYPDYDKLFDELKHTNNPVLLLGMGASVQLANDKLPIQTIKDSTFPCKIVVLCRGVGSLLNDFCANETRFEKMRFCVVDGAYDCQIIGVSDSLSFRTAINGYKKLLQKLESGESGKTYVQTALPIHTAYKIENAYSAVKEQFPSFSVSSNALSEKQWQLFLNDNSTTGYALEHWRTYLDYLINLPDNAYLKAVTANSSDYNEYQYNLINYLLDVPYTDSDFEQLYELRKELIKGYGTDKISSYIAQSQQKGNDRMYYLTDNTKEERYEIIMAITQSKVIPKNLSTIYPDLAYYLNDYIFSDKVPSELTDYFIQYKRQKLLNKLDNTFLEKVDNLSADGKRIFNLLRTKNSIIEKYDDGQTRLVWVDALGAEYLGFIQKIAQELELSLSIQVGCSVLPTLTDCNKDFYDTWKGKKELKTSELDKTKHEGVSYRDLRAKDAPVYLSDELAIIRDTMIKIKGLLLQGSKSILLTSDHGASRLVILHDKENKWTMKEKGKHGGRCCPVGDIDTKPDNATMEKTENGEEYWVLANYDRFQGGRRTGVELHGGATLEEVIVPIIKITLADKSTRPRIKNETDNPQYTYDTDPAIILFCPTPITNLRVKMEGKMYAAEKQEDNRYRVVLKDCKKSERPAMIECFDGDNLLASFDIIISGKASKKDTYADDFFS